MIISQAVTLLTQFVLPWTSSPTLVSETLSPSPTPFTHNATHFLLYGEPFQIIGGQMDPQRIPRAYWRSRLKMARAMGVNTVFSYIFWDRLEPSNGSWTAHEPGNDFAEFFKIAQEEGLYAVLRPGPYACGEHDLGGFPSWLTEIPGLVLRAGNPPFLHYAERFLANVATEVVDLQVTKGGPLLMVQVENEYGSYGADHLYVAAIRDILKADFDIPLYTNDGGVQWTLEGGSTPGVLAAVDGDPISAFEARQKYITDVSRLGPLLDGEYYTFSADVWGSGQAHQTTKYSPETVQRMASDIDKVLGDYGASMNFYMIHGGSNFGFENGALWQNRTTAFTTSYDFGAPIDESGRPSDLYWALRQALQPYSDTSEPPVIPPPTSIPQLYLSPVASLFDLAGVHHFEKMSPKSMEHYGQSYGFILYEHTAKSKTSGVVHPGDRPRDRVHVYVNDELNGVIDSQYEWPRNISVALNPGDNFKLLVENLGRVDYYSRESKYANHLVDSHKGIVGHVKLDHKTLHGWKVYPIDLKNIVENLTEASELKTWTPAIYRAWFSMPKTTDPAARDTFISIPNGVRGQVFVNGFHLGRYWLVGPQQSLYLPGSLLHSHEDNEIVVVELSPHEVNGSMVAVGLDKRQWFNRPDPECKGCVLPTVTNAPGQNPGA